jgi:hypothetical protein
MENELTYYCDSIRHLVCTPYSTENLHKMAKDLDIKKCWFHATCYPHYDIPVGMINEVMAKCTIVRPREILKITMAL